MRRHRATGHARISFGYLLCKRVGFGLLSRSRVDCYDAFGTSVLGIGGAPPRPFSSARLATNYRGEILMGALPTGRSPRRASAAKDFPGCR